MIGCHGEKQFQSRELGVPLELTRYETELLLEENVVDLCEVCLSDVSSEERDRFERSFEASFEKYKEEKVEEKKRMIIMNRDSVVEKGRKRGLGSSVSDEEIIEGKLRESREGMTMEMFFPPFQKECWIEKRVKEKKKKKWTVSEECKFRVLKELWRKGYFITPGHKFSCDFLAYEGDPEEYHARYMVLCSVERTIPQIQIAVMGRLSVQVNKDLLIAHFCPDSGLVDFSLVSWKGK